MATTDAALAIKELMNQYDRYKARWIEFYSTTSGFNEWFGQQLCRITPTRPGPPPGPPRQNTKEIPMHEPLDNTLQNLVFAETELQALMGNVSGPESILIEEAIARLVDAKHFIERIRKVI